LNPAVLPLPCWAGGVAALLNPALFALGAGLVAVPILIHLFNRRRVQRMPWAAMQWLLAAMRRHQRRLRIESWLILLLRIAAVLLLGLALARPVLTDPDLAGLLEGKRSIYLAVDTSYSMAARSQGRSVSELAEAEAAAVLSGLGSEDTVAVVVTNDLREAQSDGRTPYAILPRTVGEDGATRARERVASLRTRDAPASWADTLARVRQQMADEDVNRVVVIITDLQARDWRDERVTEALADLLRAQAAVRVVDVGGSERRNLTVADLGTASGRDAFVGRPLRLDVTIENQGAQPVEGARVSVFLDGDATPIRSLRVPTLEPVDDATGNPGFCTLSLDLPGRAFPRPGSHVIRVEVVPPHTDTGADALGLDSRRSFALRVRDRIRVLAWARSSRQARLGAEAYLRGVFERWEIDERGERVRERSPLYELRTVSSESALADALAGGAGPAPDLLVIANAAPRGRAVEQVREFVGAGGALLVFVGDALSDPAMLNDAFHADGEHRLLPYPYLTAEERRPETDDAPFALDFDLDTGHPLAGPFTGEEAASWIGLVPPAIWGRMTFLEDGAAEPAAEGLTRPANEGRVVLRFQGDGKPAVVEGAYGLGRTLWVATSIDQPWFERTLFFLPVFLDEAAVYATRPDDARLNLEVGRRIVVTWLPRDATNARFVSPGGAELQPTIYEDLGESARRDLALDRVGTAGTWRLVYERQTLGADTERLEERFAVNPVAGEGRLKRARDGDLLGAVPPESDLQILGSWSDAEKELGEVRQGEISFLLLWIALGLLVLESVLAWLFGRRSGGATTTTGLGAAGVGLPVREAG
jgi:hypothetical protein